MDNWVPYAQASVSAPAMAAAPIGGDASPAALCNECNRMLPTDEMIRYEGRFVCPTCKPLFFQKVKEGALVSGQRVYAGFWIRFGAKFIDGIILQLTAGVVGFAIGAAVANDTAEPIATVVGLLLGVAYNVFFIGKYGATPGKMALKLRVIRADGTQPSYGLAAGRYLAEILSAIILLIGYIMVAFDEEKRALHDRICDTRVVRE
jgi:uncharacterized RDD family membrane protein YckC